jgi:hypothetical protein
MFSRCNNHMFIFTGLQHILNAASLTYTITEKYMFLRCNNHMFIFAGSSHILNAASPIYAITGIYNIMIEYVQSRINIYDDIYNWKI